MDTSWTHLRKLSYNTPQHPITQYNIHHFVLSLDFTAFVSIS
nr:MAG TPA: hypothetical protein [Caudoviricetes sp.]